MTVIISLFLECPLSAIVNPPRAIAKKKCRDNIQTCQFLGKLQPNLITCPFLSENQAVVVRAARLKCAEGESLVQDIEGAKGD